MSNKSYLMLAGDKENHLLKLNDLKCDVAMINLEDGVFDKYFALNLLKQNFSYGGMRNYNKNIVVRINPISKTGAHEIEVLNNLKPHAIRIPKIKSIDDVSKALELIDDDIKIHLSIETKEAYLNLVNLKIDKRVTTVYLGILDLLESCDLSQNLLKLENPTIHYILSKFLVESKIAGLKPVFFTYQDYKNTEQFRLWLEMARMMGFDATSCISPTQVEIANKIFLNSKDEYEKAQYIVDVFLKNQKNGIVGFADTKYGFIDEPIYKDAKRMLRKF